jgi:hypothetical protein
LIARQVQAYSISMSSTQHRRILRLTTAIVVVSMLFAPTLSLASCCCVLAKLSVAAGISQTGCCDEAATASCCSSHAVTMPVKQRSCCSGGESVATASPPQGDANALPSHTSCDCEQSCCDGVNLLEPAIYGEGSSLRSFEAPAATPVFMADHESFSAGIPLWIDRSPPFLSSPHRCATLCRWLN